MNATIITHGLKVLGGLIGMGMTGGLGLVATAGAAAGLATGVAYSAHKRKQDDSCRHVKRIRCRKNSCGYNRYR